MNSIYDTFMSIFEQGALGQNRVDLIPGAYGKVLEIGSGTGVNLQYYNPERVKHIILSDMIIDPILHKKLENAALSYEIKAIDVESIPYGDKIFDTIVVTLVFCSVKNVQRGLSELRRVLKDDGQIIFIEHVLPAQEPMKGLFNILTPVWKHLASGCHLNRDFLQALEEASYETTEVSKFNKYAFVSGKAYKKAKSP